MTGDELRSMREGLYLSRLRLANAAKLSAACITRWESEGTAGGGFPMMSQEYIRTVLRALALERYLSCLAVYEQLSAGDEKPKHQQEEDALPACVCGQIPQLVDEESDCSLPCYHVECPVCGMGKGVAFVGYDDRDDAIQIWKTFVSSLRKKARGL